MWAGASVRASAHLAVGVRGWVLSFVIYREDISRDTADYLFQVMSDRHIIKLGLQCL